MNSPVDASYTFQYEGQENTRLDVLIHSKLADYEDLEATTRSQIKHWIENGSVQVNEHTVYKAGTTIKPGMLVSFTPQYTVNDYLKPYDYPVNIVFEDESLIVVDKAAGISMHPGAGNKDKTLMNALVAKFEDAASFEDPMRLGLVHRLDKDTTGLVVISKNSKILSAISEQFAARDINKEYHAFVLKTPRAKTEIDKADTGTINLAIGRHPKARIKMCVLQSGGRAAITNWNVLERMPYGALLQIKPETGRTHQIRVHMEHLKAPLIGDKTYGNFTALPKDLKKAADEFGRHALHASLLGFKHPLSNEYLQFESKLPEDYEILLDKFRKAK